MVIKKTTDQTLSTTHRDKSPGTSRAKPPSQALRAARPKNSRRPAGVEVASVGPQEILQRCSAQLCNRKSIRELLLRNDSALELIGKYLPNPSAQSVQEKIEANPRSAFAFAVTLNPKFNPNAQWIKDQIEADPNNALAHTWFAYGVGFNPRFDVNSPWVQKMVIKHPESNLAMGVASNPKFDASAQWVQEHIKVRPNNSFTHKLATFAQRIASGRGIGSEEVLNFTAKAPTSDVTTQP